METYKVVEAQKLLKKVQKLLKDKDFINGDVQEVLQPSIREKIEVCQKEFLIVMLKRYYGWFLCRSIVIKRGAVSK